MHPRRRVLPIVAVAYATALIVLGATRTFLALTPSLQVLSAMAAFVIVGALATCQFGNRGWLRGRLNGKAVVLNGLNIFLAISATLAAQQAQPELWPLIAIGLILPLFLVAELIIDWPHLEEGPTGPS